MQLSSSFKLTLQLDPLCIFQVDESGEPDITDTPVALVTVVTESTTSPVHFSPASTAIVVEDDLVMSDIPRLAEAFALLFGLMYTLHLDYPRKLIHTFPFIQKVLMGLDDGKPLKPCLLNLKNDLLLKEQAELQVVCTCTCLSCPVS